MTEELFNVVRTQKGRKTIVLPRIHKKDAMAQVRNLKRRARDNHSDVFFDVVPVPADVIASVITH